MFYGITIISKGEISRNLDSRKDLIEIPEIQES